MQKIDSIGTFTGTITEATLGETKNGFPQAIIKITAEQKYIDDPVGMKHFGLAEPAYVDWSEFNEDAVAYLVLFKSNEKFDSSTKLLNYDQLVTAVDWNGTDFDNFESFVGKPILFRMKENDYNGKVTIQVAWIDKVDADPVGSLRALDPEKVKGLSARLKMGMGGTVAKPVSAKPQRAAGKPESSTSSTPPPAPVAEEPSAAPASAPPARRGRKPKADNKLTQAAAWAAVESGTEAKGVADKAAEAWLAACEKVGGQKAEEDFTEEDWFAVKTEVFTVLGL